MDSIHRLLLQLFRRLPVWGRRRVVRTIAPSYTAGTMCFIERADGALLLVRLAYRDHWGVPGGLLKRGEEPVDGARREALEETGLEIAIVAGPIVQVAPTPQRVDLIFRCTAIGSTEAKPCSPEIVEVGWFLPDSLPTLQDETAGALALLAEA